MKKFLENIKFKTKKSCIVVFVVAIPIICIMALMLHVIEFTKEIAEQKNDSLQTSKAQVFTMKESNIKKENIKRALLLVYPKKISTWSYYDKKLKHKKIITGVSAFQAECYANIFYTLSRRFSVSWEILAAVLWTESMFNGTLKSHKDCKGLMQVSEPTAESEAFIAGIPYIKNHSLWNDFDNLELGLHHLISGLLEDPKDYSHGVSRYYAGDSYAKKKQEPIISYNNKVMLEFDKLRFIFKGLEASQDAQRRLKQFSWKL